MNTRSEPMGRVIQTWKNGLRVLWTYVPEMPAQDARSAMPWLTVVRWKYDGSGNEACLALTKTSIC